MSLKHDFKDFDPEKLERILLEHRTKENIQEESLESVMYCRMCKEKFNTKKDYKAHFKTEHFKEFEYAKENKVYAEMVYENIGYALGPKFTEIEKNFFCICHQCNQPFKGRGGWDNHVKKHHQAESEFPCKYCNKTLPTKSQLHSHFRAIHVTKGVRTVPCDLCDLKFLNESRLKVHKTTAHYGGVLNGSRPIHEKVQGEDGKFKYKCDFCGVLLNSNKSVYHHKDVYHGTALEKELKCPVENCNFKARFEANLKLHLDRNHGENLKHVCEICGKKFISPKRLNAHFNIKHVKERHECDQCEKIFTNSESLRIHQKNYHTDEKHECDKCGKSFKVRKTLMSHIKFVHMGIRRFLCKCGQSFKCKAHLVRHWNRKGHDKGKFMSPDFETFTEIDINSETK